MNIDLTKMNVIYKGAPFIEQPIGTLNLLGMNVVYRAAPFVRESGLQQSLFHKLILSGSAFGPKLKLLGHGTTRKLKVI